MYKVLLVDDEPLIREAISENTKWSELGYELTGSCKNGREAMEKIRENPPDLLLTDICMPHVDGMELAKFVYEEYQNTKVVIISGYDDFDYAKKAVTYQVMDYILKPITASELAETLERVKAKLDEERLKNKSMKKIRGAYISNLPVMRGRFLNNLIQGTVNGDTVEEKLWDYDISLEGSSFMGAVILEDDFSEFLSQSDENKKDLAYFAMYNVSEEIVNIHGCGVTFQDVEERTMIIFCGDSALEERTLEIAEELREAIRRFLKIDCTIGIGRVVPSIMELPQSFQDAKRAAEFKFLLGSNQIIYEKQMRSEQDTGTVEVSRWVGQIVLAIKSNSEIDIEELVAGFIKAIREAYVTRNRGIFYVQSFILSIVTALDASGFSETPIFSKEKELMNNIYKQEHLSEIEKEVAEFCLEICGSMVDQKDSLCKKQALMALDYIEKNFGDPKISLNSVCSHLSMSTSYFSTVFKNYTGETFIEALTKKRMEKARGLMEHTAKKTYEIAGEVGYGDPHYFSVTFKKMIGLTPTEYTRKVRKV